MSTIITKADGTTEAFDLQKLLSSLRRAGATEEAAQEIAIETERRIKDHASTHDIYHHAFELLRAHRSTAAARYSLKRALLDFGPSGFPFEAYLAELFRKEGYEATIDQHIAGKCVTHEVDVVLHKGEERVYIEAKFHNSAGFKTDLQIALYVQARIEDIQASQENGGAHARGMLITNTKFTSLVLAYARCRGMELLGWEYPENNNLHDRIERNRLYPITALTSLSHEEKVNLLSQKVVLCHELSRQESALSQAGVRSARMSGVLAEAGELCDISTGPGMQ
ncbi:MAG: restriction endonuclease [Patescibacteria group bacterium]|nr:restriction endonuclease [Patescibacteria group bacterium]